MADSAPSTAVAVPSADGAIKEVFIKFCQIGVPGATVMTGKNFSKLCKDAGIIDGKKVTNTDVDLEFSKRVPKGQKMEFKIFKLSVEALSKKKGVSSELLYDKIRIARPGMTGVTKVLNVGGVQKLTDTSKYTGSHKERFDEDGKGKGVSGREEVGNNSGFTSGYKGTGTYAGNH